MTYEPLSRFVLPERLWAFVPRPGHRLSLRRALRKGRISLADARQVMQVVPGYEFTRTWKWLESLHEIEVGEPGTPKYKRMVLEPA